MKTTIAFIAASVLSASLPVYAQGVQPNNQAKPGTPVLPPEVNSQRMYQGAGPGVSLVLPSKMPAGQPQIGGMALPQLPANLQNPLAASQVSSDIYSFMALFQKMAQEMRQTAREQRSSTMEAQVSAMQDAAEKMKQAAAANMQQAQVTSAMAIASGALQIGAGGAAQLKPGAPGQMKPGAQGQATGGIVAGPGGKLQAPTKALTPQEKQQAVGAMANAQQMFTASMTAADADKKKAEAAALVAQAQVQNAQQAQAQQMVQQMQDVMRDIQQKLQAIRQSQTATAQAIMRN